MSSRNQINRPPYVIFHKDKIKKMVLILDLRIC